MSLTRNPFARALPRHCEERKRRSNPERRLDCFATLAMTAARSAPPHDLVARANSELSRPPPANLEHGRDRLARRHGGEIERLRGRDARDCPVLADEDH